MGGIKNVDFLNYYCFFQIYSRAVHPDLFLVFHSSYIDLTVQGFFSSNPLLEYVNLITIMNGFNQQWFLLANNIAYYVIFSVIILLELHGSSNLMALKFTYLLYTFWLE